MKSSLDELITNLNQLSERVGAYSSKTYTLLSTALLLKNDVERALKICENAVAELHLDSAEGEHLLSSYNADISCLLYNYIKCILLKNGQG